MVEPGTPSISSSRGVPAFVGLFLFLVFLFYLAYIALWDTRATQVYLEGLAAASGVVLAVFVDGVQRSGAFLYAPGFSVQVDNGCDAYLPISTFVAAVLAFPAPIARKTTGLLLGVLALSVVNLVRIVSLCLVLIHWGQEGFDLMHGTVWQAAFVVAAVVLWVLWARWASAALARRGSAARVEPRS